MTLLAIDPGRSVKPSIGYALFNPRMGRGELLEKGELTWEQLCKLLFVRDDCDAGSLALDFDQGWNITEVVIENFINNPRSRGGQTNGTSEVIGAVEILATQAGVPFTRQPNTILPVAKLQAGYVDTHEHLPHQDAAFLHGYYYLVGKGILKSKGLSGTL
jgi:hypothetical protein